MPYYMNSDYVADVARIFRYSPPVEHLMPPTRPSIEHVNPYVGTASPVAMFDEAISDEQAVGLFNNARLVTEISEFFGFNLAEDRKKSAKKEPECEIRHSKDGEITCEVCAFANGNICTKHSNATKKQIKVWKTWTCDKSERKVKCD